MFLEDLGDLYSWYDERLGITFGNNEALNNFDQIDLVLKELRGSGNLYAHASTKQSNLALSCNAQIFMQLSAINSNDVTQLRFSVR